MWQRIQTLYLAIATGLIISMFFCNVATILGPEGAEVGIRYYEKRIYLIFLIMLLTANGSALFSYKLRILQMRVCVIAAFLLVGFQGWLAYDFFTLRNDMVFSITAIFPIIAAILNLLAAKNIMLDEAMVISNRIFGQSKKGKGRNSNNR